jgi:MFS transporter, FSR family, fosmidomycin resistance protein
MSALGRPGLLPITLAHITVDMQTGSLVVLLPLLLAAFDLNYTAAVAIITANNLVIAAAQPIFGSFCDRISLKWLVWAGCLTAGLAVSTVLFLPSYAAVIAAVMLAGLGSAAFHPEALSRVRAVSGRFAVSGMSIFFAGGNIGFALGPILATLLLAWGGRPGILLLLLPTLLALAALARYWSVIAQDAPKAAAKARQPQTLKARAGVAGLVALLMALITLRSTTVGGLQTFIPLYFADSGTLSSEGAAFLVTLLLVSGVAGTLLGGFVAERVGRRALMVGSMVIALAGLYLFLHSAGLPRMLAIIVSGASISAAWPVLVVMIQEAMPGHVGLASGLSLGTSYGATGLGIVALGTVADSVGLAATLQLITLLPLGVLLLTFLLPRRLTGEAPEVQPT